MRLVFLQETAWPSIGGIQILSLQALLALKRRGYEPAVIASFAGEDLPDRAEVMGIPIFRLPFRRALAERDLEAVIHCRTELARLKSELRPDVIQVNLSGPSGYFLLAAAGPEDPPFVLAVRHPIERMSGSGEGLVSRLLNRAAWVTGNSMSTLQAARAAVPGIENRSSVIYNALRIPEETPSELSFDPPELLCLGRLVPEKGFHVAIEAFSIIRESVPRARLTIAGDGPARADLEAMAEDLGLGEHVRFIGWVRPEDVAETINRSSMVLMPSEEESFGLVALESALMGRPVVASRVGGLAEVVRHGETGYTVPFDEPRAFAAASIQLLSDTDRARRFGRAAREKGLETFSFDRYVDQYDILYRRLAGQGAERRKAV